MAFENGKHKTQVSTLGEQSNVTRTSKNALAIESNRNVFKIVSKKYPKS